MASGADRLETCPQTCPPPSFRKLAHIGFSPKKGYLRQPTSGSSPFAPTNEKAFIYAGIVRFWGLKTLPTHCPLGG